jgi:glycosyltransferase involved in cell wall biosynthesis
LLERRRTAARCRALEADGLFDPAFYLESHPDVARAGIDPRRHYVLHGAREGRAASRSAALDGPFPVPGEPRSRARLEHAALGFGPGGSPRPGADVRRFAGKLARRLRHREFVLAISHDDYLASVGGVQLCLRDEEEELAAEGVSYVQVFPAVTHPTLRTPEEMLVMVQADSRAVGVVRGTDLPEVLGSVVEVHGRTCRGIAVHHLRGWSPEVVERTAARLPEAGVIFWVHDFFSVCPRHTLLRNGHEFCGAPPADSVTCRTCDAGTARVACGPIVRALLDRLRPSVAAPSEFARDLWCREHPGLAAHARVLPPVLVRHDAAPQPERVRRLEDRARRPRIAYVGSPVASKGWGTWKRVAADAGIASDFELLHLGSAGEGESAGRLVPAVVTREDRGAMVRALQTHEVDAVLLWTGCPETFSFVLQESIAAGCLVLAKAGSGNVEATIRERGGGVVLEDDEALFRLLRDPAAVRSALVEHWRCCRCGVMERNPALREAAGRPPLSRPG